MFRLLIGCAALALVVTACAAEEKKTTEKTPADEFKALILATNKALKAEKSEEAKIKVLKEYAGKFIKFAQQHPKDPSAVRALLIVVTNLPDDTDKDSPNARALAILKKNYANSELLTPSVVSQLAMLDGESIFDLLKTIFEKNTDKKARAEALKAVISNREQAFAEADGKKATEIRKEIDTYRKHIPEYKGMVKDLFIGATMPELKSKSLDDKDVKLSDLKGKVVVLDLWATWCGPCRAMIPHSRKLVARLKDKPFALVGISFDGEKDTVKEFMKTNAMPWTHWFNGEEGEIGKQLDVQFFPTIYVLDGKGVIRYRNVRGETLDKAVDTLLKEMEKTKSK